MTVSIHRPSRNPTTGAATVYLVYRPLAEEATVT
jgi:hypothetical protein